MRIGMYSPAYPGLNGTGGIPVYTQSLAIGLAELGHETHVLVCGDPDQLGAEHARDGARVHVANLVHAPLIERWFRGVRESLQAGYHAARLCRRFDLDVFEFPNFEGLGAFFRYQRLLSGRRPLNVVRLHTSTAECLAIEGKELVFADHFEIWRERQTARSADAIYVSTKAHRHHMAEELGMDEAAMGIVPLGIPDDVAKELRAPRPRAKHPTVVYVGRLEPRKGTIDLFHAIPEVLKVVPDARFLFIGNDRPLAPGRIPHARWVDENLSAEVRAHIELLGFVDDDRRKQVVEQADVFVAPSLYESFGLIFVEAMRVTVPVIGTRAGGIPEVVEDGHSGLLVKPEAPAELAAAMIRLLSDEALRLRLAAAGRARFVERFSSRAMAERTIAHHEALLTRRA